MSILSNKVLIICGPTAVGKTEFAYKIAKDLGGELVSADSRQIYKEMDIGTGKDLGKKIFCENLKIEIILNNKSFNYIPYLYKGIPIWLYDVINPDEEFSVAHYEKIAKKVIENILIRKKLPIIVGGSGLYIKSLTSPLDTVNIPPNSQLRKSLEVLSINELRDRFKKEFSEIWKNLNKSDAHNPRRLIRKIEIQRYLSNPKNKKSQTRFKNLYNDIMIIGLFCENSKIYKRIDQRVDKRVEQGILEEIQYLLKKGYRWDLPSMSAMGYRQWKNLFINNEILPSTENEDMIKSISQQWKYDEHAYARRQLTWFKKTPNIAWINIINNNEMEKMKNMILAWYNKT